MIAAFGGLEDALLALHTGARPDDAGLVAQDLERRFHVRRHGGCDRDLLIGDGMFEAQQLGVQGLPIQ